MPSYLPDTKRNLILLATVSIALTVLFIEPLHHLWILSRSSQLYSHLVLIPFLSIYLAWDTSRIVEIPKSNPKRQLALIPLAVGLTSLVVHLVLKANPENPAEIEDYLAYSVFAYASFLIGAIVAIFGHKAVRAQIFPILFLILICPLPSAAREGIQLFFQYTSAEAAYWLIKLSGVPIYREGLIFQMPTINMEVAPECSGLRSSLVLFITSLAASYLFLKSPWKRAIFVSLFIPIGIIRNAIRILVLALQCYHIGPEMIEGWFHKQGGQPLFAITLVPLFIVLYLFRRSETKDKAPNDTQAG